ncbi:MAG: hypothetical protein ABIK28_25140 [Planctomycetota bacterium]
MTRRKGNTMTSTADNPMSSWPDFMEAIRIRLEKGRDEYGDSSFSRPPAELAGEIEEELLDVAGWAFFLWLRVRDIRGAIIRKRILKDI